MAKRHNFYFNGKNYGYVVFENGNMIDMQFADPQLHLDMVRWVDGKEFSSINDMLGRSAAMWRIEEVDV